MLSEQKARLAENEAFYTKKLAELERERDEKQQCIDTDYRQQAGSLQEAAQDLAAEGEAAARLASEIVGPQHSNDTLCECAAKVEAAISKLNAALAKGRGTALGAPETVSSGNVTDSTAELEWEDVVPGLCGKIVYTVEMRTDECQFVPLCEGTENVIKVSGLEQDTAYEFRVKAHFCGRTSQWSKTVRIKTLPEVPPKTAPATTTAVSDTSANNTEASGSLGTSMADFSMDSTAGDDDLKTSKVLCGDEKAETFLRSFFGEKHFDMLYRGSADGFTAEAFHRRCDKKGPTLTLVRSDNGNIFGGYSTVAWGSKDAFRAAPGSFLLTLRNTYGTEPSTFSLLEPGCPSAIYDHYTFGPTFGGGCDLCLWPPFNTGRKCYSNIGAESGSGNGSSIGKRGSYRDVIGKGSSVFTGDSSDTKTYFDVAEIEVYSLHWNSLDN